MTVCSIQDAESNRDRVGGAAVGPERYQPIDTLTPQGSKLKLNSLCKRAEMHGQ